jgi:ribosomal protein S18 acetylase RimI-like enzyme
MMMKQKIIVAKKDKGDERRRVLSLTELGLEILPKLRPLWIDIETAVREVVDYSGVDVLAAIDGIEHAMDRESLAARCTRLRRQRDLEEVKIVDYARKYRRYFEQHNVEWLEKYFTVEPVDVEIFENCERILEDGGAIIFAKIGDEVVGTCALLKQGDGFELAKMAVTEKWRGRHIGKKLLVAALDRARELGARTVFLLTNSSLVPAVSLYRSVGFRVTHCGPHPKYARSDLAMELEL